MMTDLEIVMAYTGWNAEMAQNAIRIWQKWRPDWNAHYLLPYMQRRLTSVPADLPELAAASDTGMTPASG